MRIIFRCYARSQYDTLPGMAGCIDMNGYRTIWHIDTPMMWLKKTGIEQISGTVGGLMASMNERANS
ncbi:hypothetical protein RY831_31125 [Noviherbaspirillum sp. CPCC 100848]|uniref:Uncharacterized protein n=1 Tax=Noviherbaspirillum album TaxID=3080276 RepID=A0ABU6JIS9_9BURK|nr:hypothetical protein [Noviherbaspirillum sp. CPCC 100848]MEC4723592.1 hypothetical protein [Noviherbaspirillum sp. CPCC 100848]